MVGREMTDRFPKRQGVKIGDVSMEVKNWNVYHPLYTERKVVNNVSFKVHKGEGVGISGLMGAGRTETARALFGANPKQSGKISIMGKDGQLHEVTINSPQDAVKYGIGYLSEDRRRYGVVVQKSVTENTTQATMEEY